MNGIFLFVFLPYLALLSLIAGGIYRYWYMRFSVSSLSSQLLESRLLYFGSRPFHWGIVTLLFGHLTGLLFPSGVLAWNGRPFRLYILEVTAAALAVASLIGLIVLAVRRADNKRVRSVTSQADIVLYVVLATVIITGLLTAILSRWGSSWFAVVVTPYLRSILFFRPDVSVVNTLPLIVKIHIISTFIFITIIPYTRLIHILAYPFTYFWREYQLVIWNKRKSPEGTESRTTTIPLK